MHIGQHGVTSKLISRNIFEASNNNNQYIMSNHTYTADVDNMELMRPMAVTLVNM
ncbi:hypothetical protein SAMD00019534_094360 [Acytostelium subglobosum LB1]|uniref:hypothetical protein n=1 Tax=Acytostelium subglobosum LB1 TaxID=1410327 RepID=UPI0006450D80|nr:hypothetical protein SAMD00019534_094360 [Acytostelium subglobosum LB1]GAM26261.1 hypothetical protein SAMD00019534_094360 [Acytostelium subglobosum LB1]|eukprot:XP_012750815.1 hypothetical protein SAMD00019534_094360 [Acytostelium subglobosum LB1]